MNWFLLVCLILVNAIAGVFVKLGSSKSISSYTDFFNLYYLLGIFFYGLSFILFAAALKKLPLNVVHPIATSGTVAIVALLAYVFLKEILTLHQTLGLVFITLGIFLITWK
ncbi:MAG: SMR family transporter [Deltaproteobacteria bacterium]|nr:SMR family transporter [Deltaproteobacteria bacterium]MCX7953013.1 SMR family transporter [Deltaproteobacteria bacterium]